MTRAAFHALKRILGRLLKSPAYALLTVAMLSVGLGTSLLMFSGVNSWILKPLPFADGHELVALWRDQPARGVERMSVLPHDYLDWREQQTSMVDLAAVSTGTINLSDDQRPERYRGAFITAKAFDLLRVQPVLGRAFTESETRPGEAEVAVIGDRVWRQRYSADPAVIGRQIRINSRPATIIGVMPSGFRFPMNEEVWVPLRLDPSELARGEGPGLDVFGRLNAGVSLRQARDEMERIARQIARNHPETNDGIGAVVVPYSHSFVDRQTRALIWTMFAAVLTVLAIACANVANLTLARTTTRRRELAVRSALGANRRRLIGAVLGELALLSLAGLLLGLWLAEVLGHGFDLWWDQQGFDTPYWIRHSIDWRYLLFGGGAAMLSVVLAGLLPALRATRIDFYASLKDGGHGTTGSALGGFRRGLVISQVALSCVLLVSSGLMIRSLEQLNELELGIGVDPDRVLTARLGLFDAAYPRVEDRRLFYSNLVEQLRGLPDAHGATLATSLPGTGAAGNRHTDEARFSEDLSGLPLGRHVIVGEDYFQTFRIPRLSGRLFDSRDRHDTRPVAVIDRRMAEQHWSDGQALGRRLWLNIDGGRWFEVVGVVESVQQDPVTETPRPTAYLPLSQHDVRFVSLAVSAPERAATLVESVHEAVARLDPDLPLYWVRSLDDALKPTTFLPRLLAAMFGLFGAVAVALVAVGVFAVLAYAHSQRIGEIGLRRALGASNTHVVSMVLGESLKQLAIGLAAGLTLAAAFTQLLGAWLIDISPMDPATFSAVIVLLLTVTLAAGIVPLRRALAVEPVAALRHE